MLALISFVISLKAHSIHILVTDELRLEYDKRTLTNTHSQYGE